MFNFVLLKQVIGRCLRISQSSATSLDKSIKVLVILSFIYLVVRGTCWAFCRTTIFEKPWLVRQKPINVLSTAFADHLLSIGVKLHISTYIRDKLEESLDNYRLRAKLVISDVGYYCDSKFVIVANKVQ